MCISGKKDLFHHEGHEEREGYIYYNRNWRWLN
jgi:hypothetical protein